MTITPWDIQSYCQGRGLHVSVADKAGEFLVKGAIRGAQVKINARCDVHEGQQILSDWLDEIMPKRKGPKGQVLYRADAVFLADLPEIDIEGLNLSVGRGKAAVLMAPPRNMDRGFYLSDEFSGAFRPDVGRVVAVGPDCDELSRGDYVVCRPYSGFVYEEFHNGQRIQFFGRVLNEMQEFESTPWDDCIVMKWADRWVPVGRNMAVSRSKPTETAGGVLIAGKATKWDDFGKVLECGGYVDDSIEDGIRVWWKDAGPEELLHIEYGEAKDVWIVHDSLILAVEAVGVAA